MADVTVAKVSDADRAVFVDLLCEENHYDQNKTENETKEEFADRTFQSNLDKKILDVAGKAWQHGMAVALAGAEDKYVKDNPPPTGYHVDPPRADLVAEFKAL